MYKIAINRPIATLMYVMTLIIFGFLSFKSMPAALFPNVDFPIVTIKTIYPGADASTIESEVTDKIEDAISTIGGVDSVVSTSSEDVSVVMVKFFLERDINEATNDVRDKISAIELPRDAKRPLVSKLDIAGAPVINIFLSTKNSSLKDLMLFADKKVKPFLQKQNGVGDVNIIGYREKEIKIFPKLDQLNKYHLSIRELNNIIKAENIKIGGGKLIDTDKELILKTKADAHNIDELRNIQIIDNVKLKDIATVVEDLSDAKSYSSLNGKSGVMLEVKKISGTNTLSVVKAIKKTIPQLQKIAKERFDIKLLQDTSPFIINSLNDVKFDLIYGAILAVVIIFVFLRNMTITLVSALSIPISILGTIALMRFMGFDLNKLTLIGLTLSIGIIIDDAIVVLENIYKKMEEGMGRFEAALYGVKEMAFAILAISAMLLAVFIPVANMSGIVGKFFESFAMTVAFAIIISYTIAMSFMPSLSARVLEKRESFFYRVTEPIFKIIDKSYAYLLKGILRFKYIALILVLLTFIGSLSLFPKIGMDFIPKEDKSEFEVKLRADPSISLENMKTKSQKIVDMIQKSPLVEFATLSIGYNSSQEKNKALIYVKLLPKDKRSKNQEEIIEEFRKKLEPFKKEMFITAAAIPNIKGAGVTVPYQIVLMGDSFQKLKEAKDRLISYLSKKKGFVDIDSNMNRGKEEIDLLINRTVANRYGITAAQIAQTIATAFSSDIAISHYEKNGKQYDISLRVSDSDRRSIDDIKKLQLRAKNGKLIYLDSLVDFHKTTALSAIHHYNQARQVSIFSDLFGLDLGGAVNYTKAKIDEILPDGISYKFTGFAEEMVKTGKAFAQAVILSVILMYIILAILYESLIQPIIIMMALPLSIIGVMLALYLSHLHFSLFVMIGFMLLMGMVGKNAVLLVDFANEAIKENKSVDQALLEAGEKRLRPILMTTIAMVFAMLPLAISNSLGSETKAPMAISIIGGLLSSMFLTLLVVPVIYKLIYPLDRWLRSKYERKVE